jgi:iron(III) transport system substrate-binding protein
MIPARRLALILGGLLVGCVFLNGCAGPSRVPVVVYSPHGRDLLEATERAYELLHPEVDVRWLDMGSQEVYDRVRSEQANPQADVWFGGPDTIFARGAREGLLDGWLPEWSAKVPEASRRDGFVGAYRTLPILVWNTELVSDAQAPRDWEDLLDARWRGKLLLRDPLASGTLRTVFAMVLAGSVAETGKTDAGYAWLRRLDAQTREYAPNPAILFEKLLRREGAVTIWELSDILLQQKRGVPLQYGLASSGTPVINDAVALVRGAPHADAARGFIEWIGSEEAQLLACERAFKIPARSDLPVERLAPWAREVLAKLVPAPMDSSLVEREVAGWMDAWDQNVRGRGAS